MYVFLIEAAKPKGEAPSLEEPLKPKTVIIGEETQLVCKVTGNPEPKIEWFKDGKPLIGYFRIKTDYDGTFSKLNIEKATVDDIGEYKCVASNEFGSVQSGADLSVKQREEKPTIIERMRELKVDLGNKVIFKVVAKGNPKPEADWTKGDKAIEDKGRFMIKDDEEHGVFKLIIDDAQPEDAGIYDCVVFNELGEVTTSAELQVMKVEVLKQITPEEEGQYKNIYYKSIYIAPIVNKSYNLIYTGADPGFSEGGG